MIIKRCLIPMLFLFIAWTFPTIVHAQDPTSTPVPDVPGCLPNPDQIVLRFGGARPESTVLNDVDLLTQPQFGSDAHPITLITIPKGARVVVFDIDNVQGNWYRILWACDNFAYSGWVPKDGVHFFSGNANPINAPPACVRSVTALDSLDDIWTSTIQGRMVVVVDMFRTPDHERIDTFFYLTLNGREVHDKEREIRTEGPFLLNGEVVNAANVSKGMDVGFLVTNSADTFRTFATVYLVPDGCTWDV